MKIVLCLSLLACLAVPAPVDSPQTTAQNLEKRAETLLDRVNKVTAMFKGSYPHMLRQLNYQTNLVEAIVAKLKQVVAQGTAQLHEVNVLEEELLNLEHRVEEEIDILKQIGHGFVPKGETVAQLIAHAQQVIASAKTTLTKTKVGAFETRDIQQNINVIELLVKNLQDQPNQTADLLAKVEQELAIHELSLQKLTEKVNAHSS